MSSQAQPSAATGEAQKRKSHAAIPGKHTPLQFLLFLRNPMNAHTLEKNYAPDLRNGQQIDRNREREKSATCRYNTRTQTRETCRKAFMKFIERKDIAKVELPEKPLARFKEMSAPVRDYIRPTIEKMLRDKKYGKYFKKSSITPEKEAGITRALKKLLAILKAGSAAAPSNDSQRKRRTMPAAGTTSHKRKKAEKEFIIVQNNAISKKQDAKTQTATEKINVCQTGINPVEVKLRMPATSYRALSEEDLKTPPGNWKSTESCISLEMPRSDPEATWEIKNVIAVQPPTGHEDNADLLRSISKQYCANCWKRINPNSMYIALQCLHRVCKDCQELLYERSNYIDCAFCHIYIKGICIRESVLPPRKLNELSISGIQVDEMRYTEENYISEYDRIRKDFVKGKRFILTGIERNLIVCKVGVANPVRIPQAYSVEMFDTDIYAVLNMFVESISNLQKLVMIKCNNVGANIRNIVSCFESSVKCLNLCECHINDAAMAILLEHTNKFALIEELSLDDNELTSKSGDMIASFIRGKTELRVLDLSGNPIAKGYTPILEEVSGMKVRRLGLGLCEISTVNETIINTFRNTSLEHIYLGDNPCIGSMGAENIASGLASNNSLKILRLRNCRIRDEGAIAIASALRNNQKLFELSLGTNGITNRGALFLAELLSQNNTLAVLYLNDNPITEDILEVFGKVLTDNRSLMVLGLANIRLNNGSVPQTFRLICVARGLVRLCLGYSNFNSHWQKRIEYYARETNKDLSVEFLPPPPELKCKR